MYNPVHDQDAGAAAGAALRAMSAAPAAPAIEIHAALERSSFLTIELTSHPVFLAARRHQCRNSERSRHSRRHARTLVHLYGDKAKSAIAAAQQSTIIYLKTAVFYPLSVDEYNLKLRCINLAMDLPTRTVTFFASF
jgi:hypothetical protein